jgi:hypothetical protein
MTDPLAAAPHQYDWAGILRVILLLCRQGCLLAGSGLGERIRRGAGWKTGPVAVFPPPLSRQPTPRQLSFFMCHLTQNENVGGLKY